MLSIMPAAAVPMLEAEHRILRTLRNSRGVATAGDVAAGTGLPIGQVELSLQRMLSLYKSHLDVDENGNLLYRFDPSLRRRGEDAAWWWHRTRQAAWRIFKAFFKVWIMVMLIGYTVAFLVLLLVLSMAGMASGSSSQDRRDRGGGIGLLPFYLLTRIVEALFWIDLGRRTSGYGYSGWGMQSYEAPRRSAQAGRAHRSDKPIYQRIFQYVFGPETNADKLSAARAFARFVRARQGRLTAAEWASRTGQSLQQADEALTGGIVRFNGTVDVAGDGTLIYRFDQLQVTGETSGSPRASAELPPIWSRRIAFAPLTGNRHGTNTWITILNAFNLVMATVVSTGAFELPLAATIGLGIVPLVFSAVFFLVPLLRWVERKRELKQAKEEEQRRRALAQIFRAAESGQPLDARRIPATLSGRLLTEYEGEVRVEEGRATYVFPRLSEQLRSAKEARATAEGSVAFGRTVFSSDPEKLSLEQAALADFDERLARELAGGAELEVEVPSSEPRKAWA